VNLKLAAARAIASAIANAIPDLAAVTEVGEDDATQQTSYPALRVLPERMEFQPQQAEALTLGVDPDVATFELEEVGTFSGTLELRLYSAKRSEREEFEQQILDLFLASEGAPGSLRTTISDLVLAGRQTLYAAPVVAYLDSEDWREELVFGAKRMSFLMLDFTYPALVIRGAYDIDSLRIAIATSLEATTPDEVVEVQEDGSYTASS
jgi:hypothetical protein